MKRLILSFPIVYYITENIPIHYETTVIYVITTNGRLKRTSLNKQTNNYIILVKYTCSTW